MTFYHKVLEFEGQLIEEALARNGGCARAAQAELGLCKSSLYRKLKAFRKMRAEKKQLQEALQRNGGNIAATMVDLNLTRPTILTRIKQFGIEP